MGTRNLTMVIKDGKTKVAQYGQWDGYPGGQGATAVEFLRKADLAKFGKQLDKCRFFSKKDEGEKTKFMKSIGIKDGWMNGEQADKYHAKFPYLNRDHGAGILQKIYDSKNSSIILMDSSDFAADSLFCEWAYVIDLDTNKFEVYRGFNHKPVKKTERFGIIKNKEGDYYPIKFVKSYPLNKLPTDDKLTKECDPPEDED